MGAFGAPMDSPRLDHAHSRLTHLLRDKLSAPIFFIGKNRARQSVRINLFVPLHIFFVGEIEPIEEPLARLCFMPLLLLLLTVIAIAIAYC